MKVCELMDVLCTGQRVLILEMGGKSHFVYPDSVCVKINMSLGEKKIIRVRLDSDGWGPIIEVHT